MGTGVCAVLLLLVAAAQASKVGYFKEVSCVKVSLLTDTVPGVQSQQAIDGRDETEGVICTDHAPGTVSWKFLLPKTTMVGFVAKVSRSTTACAKDGVTIVLSVRTFIPIPSPIMKWTLSINGSQVPSNTVYPWGPGEMEFTWDPIDDVERFYVTVMCSQPPFTPINAHVTEAYPLFKTKPSPLPVVLPTFAVDAGLPNPLGVWETDVDGESDMKVVQKVRWWDTAHRVRCPYPMKVSWVTFDKQPPGCTSTVQLLWAGGSSSPSCSTPPDLPPGEQLPPGGVVVLFLARKDPEAFEGFSLSLTCSPPPPTPHPPTPSPTPHPTTVVTSPPPSSPHPPPPPLPPPPPPPSPTPDQGYPPVAGFPPTHDDHSASTIDYANIAEANGKAETSQPNTVTSLPPSPSPSLLATPLGSSPPAPDGVPQWAVVIILISTVAACSAALLVMQRVRFNHRPLPTSSHPTSTSTCGSSIHYMHPPTLPDDSLTTQPPPTESINTQESTPMRDTS